MTFKQNSQNIDHAMIHGMMKFAGDMGIMTVNQFGWSENFYMQTKTLEYMKQSPKQLKKSIRSFEKQILKHSNLIKNPHTKMKHWDKLSYKHQQSLLYHWRQDIQRAEEFKEIAETVYNLK